MPLHEISGHVLKVGDRVKMNIEALAKEARTVLSLQRAGKIIGAI